LTSMAPLGALSHGLIFEYIVFEIADELCNNDDIYALAGGNE